MRTVQGCAVFSRFSMSSVVKYETLLKQLKKINFPEVKRLSNVQIIKITPID